MKNYYTLAAMFCCTILFCQNFIEKQLPTPDQLSPLFPGSLLFSTIHYGATPPNYNGNVIVYTHGYIDLNQVYFNGNNTFYKESFNEGYQTAFVATTRGEGLWVNGRLLAKAIDIITARYNVPEVYVIAHSNGGKAAEVAMTIFEKRDKMKQVFALGTPYWGTYIANISQFPALNWLWRPTGLNDGARTSTTYYNRDIVRPILDNHPFNAPEKFVVLGVSGFDKGSDPIRRGLFTFSGKLLLPVQGTNDGITPYSSSLRPGATYVFEANDPRALFDHLDVGLGQFSWSYIKPFLENEAIQDVNHSSIAATKSPQSTIVKSDYYMVNSENEYDYISYDKNNEGATADIFYEDENAIFHILDSNHQKRKTIRKPLGTSNQIKVSLSKDDMYLQSSSRFVAFIRQQNSIEMTLKKLGVKNEEVLKISFSNKNEKIFNDDIKVTGMLFKNSEVDGTSVVSENEIVTFTPKKQDFYFDTKHLDSGIYHLMISADQPSVFKRSMLYGFAKGALSIPKLTQKSNIKQKTSKDSVYITQNVISNSAILNFNEIIKIDRLKLEVYDTRGRMMTAFELAAKENKSFDLSPHLELLSKGIYYLKVQNLKTISFILK